MGSGPYSMLVRTDDGKVVREWHDLWWKDVIGIMNDDAYMDVYPGSHVEVWDMDNWPFEL